MQIWWKIHFQGYKRTLGQKKSLRMEREENEASGHQRNQILSRWVPVQGVQCNCSSLKYTLLPGNKHSTVNSWTPFVWPCLMDLVVLIKMCGVHEELITTHSWEGHVGKKSTLTNNCVVCCLECLWSFKGVTLLTVAILIRNLSLHYQPPCMKEKTERFLKDTLVSKALGRNEWQ